MKIKQKIVFPTTCMKFSLLESNRRIYANRTFTANMLEKRGTEVPQLIKGKKPEITFD
jgi:hypothetical protein